MYCFFFFQAEDGIRDLVRSRGLGDVYKRQSKFLPRRTTSAANSPWSRPRPPRVGSTKNASPWNCLLYTSGAADERSSVDLGGRRIIKKKNRTKQHGTRATSTNEHNRVHIQTEQAEREQGGH